VTITFTNVVNYLDVLIQISFCNVKCIVSIAIISKVIISVFPKNGFTEEQKGLKNMHNSQSDIIFVCFLNRNYIDIERKYRLPKVCYVPATSDTFLAFLSFSFAAATNSTNQTNKAGSTCH
jgi:hypothetical protein